ncbi:MAG: AAA family ATPase [Chloroflexota bacterium]
MENPFTYGVVVTGKNFTGRTAELAELKLDLRSGQNVVITSPRRYGKTSLVFQTMDELTKEGTLIAYLDLMLSETKAELASSLANALYDGLVAPFDRAWKKAGDFFSRLSLRPKFTVDESGKPVVEIATAVAERDVDRILRDLLALPDKIAQERQKQVVVVIDEFQEIVSIDAHLPATMRAIFQQQREVSHVFLGSKRHIMTEVFTKSNQPLYRMAKVLPLGAIAHDDFEEFLHARFASTATQVSEGAVDRILEITACHPHDTQQLAYFAWSNAYLHRQTVTPELVDDAFRRVLEVEDDRLTIVWESLPRSQRLLLKSLAVADGREVYSEEYRLRHGLGAPTTVQAAIRGLRNRDLIDATGEGYAIADRLLSAWLRRHRSGPEPDVRIPRGPRSQG